MKIEGQAALVTGGASGLGEATARELASTATPRWQRKWRPRSAASPASATSPTPTA